MHIARRALTYTVQNDVQTDLVQTEEQSRARVGESGIFGCMNTIVTDIWHYWGEKLGGLEPSIWSGMASRATISQPWTEIGS